MYSSTLVIFVKIYSSPQIPVSVSFLRTSLCWFLSAVWLGRFYPCVASCGKFHTYDTYLHNLPALLTLRRLSASSPQPVSSPLGVNHHLTSKENCSSFISVWKFLASIKRNQARINSPLLCKTHHIPGLFPCAQAPPALENKNLLYSTF